MIAHVAEVGEDKGRVVLWLGPSAQASPTAIEAAMLLARAFQSEVESLFVEDRQLFGLASFSFARVIASGEEGWRSLPNVDLEREIRFIGAALQRRVADAANGACVAWRGKVVRDDPLRALARACTERGPWNVVAVAEPFGPGNEERLRELFATVLGTTGVVITGLMARRTQGPVVAAVEEIERLGPMLKAAERLKEVSGGSVKLLLVGDHTDNLAWLEGEARLLLGDNADVALDSVLVENRDITAVAEALRGHKAGFVLAQYGGFVVPAQGSLRPLAAALECPMLLVR